MFILHRKANIIKEKANIYYKKENIQKNKCYIFVPENKNQKYRTTQINYLYKQIELL